MMTVPRERGWARPISGAERVARYRRHLLRLPAVTSWPMMNVISFHGCPEKIRPSGALAALRAPREELAEISRQEVSARCRLYALHQVTFNALMNSPGRRLETGGGDGRLEHR